MRTAVRIELTNAELEAWIDKRTAESSAESNLHLWDWQAMRHLKAERDRLRETLDDIRKQLADTQTYLVKNGAVVK